MEYEIRTEETKIYGIATDLDIKIQGDDSDIQAIE